MLHHRCLIWFLEVVQDSKINLKWMSAKMLEKTVPFLNMDTLRRDIPRYRSNSLYMFYWIAVRIRYAKFTVMHLYRNLFFNLLPATSLKKRRRHTYFSLNFAKFFRSNFITEKLQRIGFEGTILRKMAHQHSYSKEIS